MTQQQHAWLQPIHPGTSSDIGRTSENRHETQDRQGKTNQKTRRSPVAIHSGLGFGAGLVRERSRHVAAEANEQRQTRVRELLSEPVGGGTRITQTAPIDSVPSQSFDDAPQFDTEPTRVQTIPLIPSPPHGSIPAITAPSSRGNTLVTPLSANSKQPTSATPILSPAQQHMHETGLPLSRGRALLGWMLDGTVAVSALIGASLANLLYPPGHNIKVSSVLLRKLGELTHIGSPFALTILVRTAALAMLLLFAAQFLMFLLARASAGRFAVGASLPRESFGARLVDALFGALSEVLTLGGVLSLPFLLLMPERTPLAPWLRFRIPLSVRRD
jgi:hypothetical protein